MKLLRQIPSIGPIRSALLVALLQTPHRFRTKRQLWAYSGFAVETHDSGEYRSVRGKLERNRERMTVRGLNDNHNRRSEKSVQKCCHLCQLLVPDHSARLLCGSGGERDAANDGPSHPGTEDGRHHFNHLEERSGVRRQTIASTSSLSISEEQAFPSLRFSLVVVGRVLRDARFEGEYQSMRSAPCASAPSHPFHAMPPRITRNSDRPRASDRTMVATQIDPLAASCTLDALSPAADESYRNGRQPQAKHLAANREALNRVGWISRQESSRPPVEARAFFLTSLFIELIELLFIVLGPYRA